MEFHPRPTPLELARLAVLKSNQGDIDEAIELAKR